MAIPRRRTLQDLLSSIGSGAAPVYGGNANLQRGMSSPYMPSQTYADPTKPYGPQGDPFQPNQTVLKDVVPTYQDVNPFIWDQRSGNPSKTYFDEYIQLLTDRHPNFAVEYAANPHAAFEKYEGASGLSGNLMSAYDYHSGAELGPVGVGLTPTMIDQNIRDYGIDAVYGPNVRPNTITTESSLAGMGGLLDSDAVVNNGGGILGTV